MRPSVAVACCILLALSAVEGQDSAISAGAQPGAVSDDGGWRLRTSFTLGESLYMDGGATSPFPSGCYDDPTWDAGHGNCTSYGSGGNNEGYCVHDNGCDACGCSCFAECIGPVEHMGNGTTEGNGGEPRGSGDASGSGSFMGDRSFGSGSGRHDVTYMANGQPERAR